MYCSLKYAHLYSHASISYDALDAKYNRIYISTMRHILQEQYSYRRRHRGSNFKTPYLQA